MLAQEGSLAEGVWRVAARCSRSVIPPLGLQEVDADVPAHEVHKAAAQRSAGLLHLMFRVQAEGGLAGLQEVADQELEEVALALAGAAQDEDALVGLVLCPAAEVHDDIGAVFVPAQVEAPGVGLAGKMEWEEVGL